MNITFLIGNGFDLACGLPTSYADVYEEYIKQPSESLVVKKFKEDLIANKTKEKWGNWADFEMGMADYAKNFETEKEFIACVSDFKFFLTNYLRKIEIEFYKSFSKIDQDNSSRIKRLIDRDIINYYSGVSKNIERKLKVNPPEPINRKFINFNYTRIFDWIMQKSSFNGSEKIHIHGLIGEDNLTLGVNAIEQIKTKFTLTNKGKRVFIKPFFNEEYDEEKLHEVMKIMMDSDCICVFGLSLGNSDLMWKTGIVNWLKQSNDHHFFIYDYNCSKINITDAALKMNEEDDQKETILKRLGVFTDDCPFLGQVHIPIGKQLFNIFADINSMLENINAAKSA